MSENFNPFNPVKPHLEQSLIFPTSVITLPSDPAHSSVDDEYQPPQIDLEQNEIDMMILELNSKIDTSPVYTKADLDKMVASQVIEIRKQLEAEMQAELQNQVRSALKPENLIREARITAKNKLGSWVTNAKNFLHNDAVKTKQEVAGVWSGFIGGAKKLLNISVDTGNKVAQRGVETVFNVGSVAAAKGKETYEQAKQVTAPISEKVREVSFNLANNSYEIIGNGERAIEQYSRLEDQLSGLVESYQGLQTKHIEVEENIKEVVMQGLGKQEHRDELDLLNAELIEVNHQIDSIQEGAATVIHKIDNININGIIDRVTSLHDKIEQQNPGYMYAEGLTSKLNSLMQKLYNLGLKYNNNEVLPQGLSPETNPYYNEKTNEGTNVSQVAPVDTTTTTPILNNTAAFSQKPLSPERVKRITELTPNELLFELTNGNISSVITALNTSSEEINDEQLKAVAYYLNQVKINENPTNKSLALALMSVPYQQPLTNYQIVFNKVANIKFWEEVLTKDSSIIKFIPKNITLQIVNQAKEILKDSNNITVIDDILEVLRNTTELSESEKSGLYSTHYTDSETQQASTQSIDDLLSDTNKDSKYDSVTQVESEVTPAKAEIEIKKELFLSTNPEDFSTSLLSPTYHDVIPVLLKENPDYFTQDKTIQLLNYTKSIEVPIPFVYELATHCLTLFTENQNLSKSLYENAAKFVRETDSESFDEELQTIIQAIAIYVASYPEIDETMIDNIYNADIPEANVALLQNQNTILKSNMHNGFKKDENPLVQEAYNAYLLKHPQREIEDTGFNFDEPVIKFDAELVDEPIISNTAPFIYNEKVLDAEFEDVNEIVFSKADNNNIEAQSGMKYRPKLKEYETLYIRFGEDYGIAFVKVENGIILTSSPETVLQNQTYLFNPNKEYSSISIEVNNGAIQQITVEAKPNSKNIEFEIN